MKPETFIIVNPTAGDGRAKTRWQDFEKELTNNQIRYHAEITESKNHATKLVANLKSILKSILKNPLENLSTE